MSGNERQQTDDAVPARVPVLLVDDRSANLLALEALLASPQYELVGVTSGAEALRQVEQRDFAVVLLDVMMPGMDGFETAQRMRHVVRQARPTPIIFVTAIDSSLPSVLTAYEGGAVDFIEKPLQPVIVRSKVAVFAELYRARELVDAERARRQTEAERARLQTMFDEAPAAICVLRGEDLTIELANPPMLAVWGRDAAVVRRPLFEAVPELLGQGFGELLRQVRATGAAHRGKEVLARIDRNGDGVPEDVYFDFVFAPLRESDGRVDAIYVHAYEVTDKILARQHVEQLRRAAEAANRLKDEFLATMSHELRTPAHAILGWSTILLRGGRDPESVERALSAIDRNAKAQARLIDDVLDVSRIINGKFRLDMRRVHLAAIARAAIEVVSPTADAKGVALVSHIASDTGGIVGDADRLQQVLWNLLINGIKFTPRGGTVTLRVERVGSSLHVVVTDTGAGIAAEHLPFLFERFRQVDGSTTREHGGLGLGLAITRHIVELHGGSVGAESAGLGLGSTFTVTLPVRAVSTVTQEHEAQADAANAPLPAASSTALAGRQILVVDDDEDSRAVIEHALKGAGAAVLTADSASSALALLESGPIDVLVSDIGMPGEDGLSLLQRIRTLPADRGGRVPAIALTAYARLEDAARALRAGYQRHLSKPADVDVLVGMVAALASGAPLQDHPARA